MSKTHQLAKKLRLPEQSSGTAQWDFKDLMGSTHQAVLTWDHDQGYIDVATKIDGLDSLHAHFHVVARSLRLKQSSGFPDGVSGSKGVANHLAELFIQGPAPQPVVRHCSRPSP